MNKEIVIIKNLKWFKDLIKRFEENPNLTKETNTFFNGSKLEVLRE